MNKKTLLSLIITISLIIISCESYKEESSFVVKCPQLRTFDGLTTLDGTKFTGSCEVEEDNIVYEVKSFKNGIPHGIYKSFYYLSGKLEYSGYRKNGEIHGEYVMYHENGNIAIKGMLKRGYYTGQWNYYDEQGNLSDQKQYRRGKEINKN